MTPEVGSRWKTRDGRHYEVTAIVDGTHAVMKLLNERVGREGSERSFHRRGITMSLRRFPTYMRPLDEEGWSERRPDYAKRSRATVAPSAEYLERLKRAVTYDPETGDLTWIVDRSRIKAGQRAGVLTPRGYYRIRFEGRDILAQHIAWVFLYGAWPTLDLDHVDGDRTNNRPGNLREATNQQNQRNRKPQGGKSRFKGVSPAKAGRWLVMFERRYLGTFDSEEEAARVYDRAAIERDPVFARTNFPRDEYDVAQTAE